MAEITGKEHQPETNKRTLHWPLATGHWPQWLVGDGSDTGDGASSELQVSVRDDTCIRIYTWQLKSKDGGLECCHLHQTRTCWDFVQFIEHLTEETRLFVLRESPPQVLTVLIHHVQPIWSHPLLLDSARTQ